LSGFSSVRDRKSDPGPSTRDSSEMTKPSRGSRHYPTNSDYDRLAKTFEDLHSSNKYMVQQLPTNPVTVPSAANQRISENPAHIQPVAPERTFSPAGQRMRQEIESLLNSPQTSSARPLSEYRSKSISAIANTHLQEISSHLSPVQVDLKTDQLAADVLVSHIQSSAVSAKLGMSPTRQPRYWSIWSGSTRLRLSSAQHLWSPPRSPPTWSPSPRL